MENSFFDLLRNCLMNCFAAMFERVEDIPSFELCVVNVKVLGESLLMTRFHAYDNVGPVGQFLTVGLSNVTFPVITHRGQCSTHFWCHA
jgi:hypothetical protein